jgi:SagB-type dehydrogenase family enzyme
VKRRELITGLAAALLAGGCAQQAPGWVRGGQARYTRQIALPRPATAGPVSLEQAIKQRRSRRTFRPDPLPAGTIGQLLWAGQGITSLDGERAAPSAGALYPLELYAVTPAEVMHYLPQGHRAEVRSVPDLRPALQAAAFGQPYVGAAPVVIVVAAVPDRTRRKYGSRAEAFVDLEAGHAAQNILLQATVRGLAAVPVGSLDPSRAAQALALPPDQTVRYLIPVGVAP